MYVTDDWILREEKKKKKVSVALAAKSDFLAFIAVDLSSGMAGYL